MDLAKAIQSIKAELDVVNAKRAKLKQTLEALEYVMPRKRTRRTYAAPTKGRWTPLGTHRAKLAQAFPRGVGGQQLFNSKHVASTLKLSRQRALRVCKALAARGLIEHIAGGKGRSPSLWRMTNGPQEASNSKS